MSSTTIGAFVGGVAVGACLIKALSSATTASGTEAAGPAGPVSPAALLKLVQNRRSVFPKDYNGENIPEETVWELLEAANWAPTHGKTEPWRFIVLPRDSASFDEFFQLDLQEKRHAFNFKSAADEAKFEGKAARKQVERENVAYAILIVVKRVPNRKGSFMPEWEETSSVAMAVQNLHLQAAAHGLAGYWSSGGWDSSLQSSAMKQFLELQPEDRCLGIFYLGQSDKIDSYRGARTEIRSKVAWK